ncbi:unnamed protein product [Chondrus crispus]|uniref:EF-hand domain-containing protein n=1 Tax=Chondrus crispus TaxID=2769 RepID=R7QPX4_CHOCR|nr:unnamed protein product [Chondrus crispus]CDF39506.1 unnamed protein product [Chondrus crispus]|eukprot:XP_005719417.1 unnamed protein product [Chondrus crispus]
MESLFIAPAVLPGGRDWSHACTSVGAHASTNISDTAAEATASPALDALRCDATPFSGLIQVFFLLCVYGVVLFKASQLITEGSELLLLVPSLRGIVGSVVLPILGAVPDGAIVLFSGLGPDAQETLQVGVGALAGSTAMLLTIPWFLTTFAGRVNIVNGVATYHQKPHKLHPPGNMSLDRTGVQPLPMVGISGRIMLVTATSLLVIQAAAISTGSFFASDQTASATRAAAKSEKIPAIICLVICLTLFFWYLHYQITAPQEEIEYRETVVDELKQKAIRHGELSLSAAFKELWDVAVDANESTGLIAEERNKKRLSSLLKIFFHEYDTDCNNRIDKLELTNLMRDLGEKCTPEETTMLYTKMDSNGDGKITLNEFVAAMPEFIMSKAESRVDPASSPDPVAVPQDTEAQGAAQAGSEASRAECEEEDEEVPHDLRDKDPETQIRNVMRRSFLMLALGTTLVLIFSDPVVTVMTDVGQRIGVAPFYVSFVLAPLASNASEVLAAYSYAVKKTRKTVTISFSTLLGAAILNNTFVLSIFMFLIVVKGLAWQFTAETISILVVEVFVGWISQKKVMTLRHGIQVLLMFPVAIATVAFLENVVGLD